MTCSLTIFEARNDKFSVTDEKNHGNRQLCSDEKGDIPSSDIFSRISSNNYKNKLTYGVIFKQINLIRSFQVLLCFI